ncbi:PPOX class F420-dependent oxidoreductase [Nocardioidaceae bacterium]|nr:PPOX class F420-dependent oxidoreductase [Nocardioidaceae bacterium]
MPRTIATTTDVDRESLLDFVRPRHKFVLITPRRDGRTQSSPVTGGVDPEGRLVVASYPQRAKVRNVRRHGSAAVLVLSDDFEDAWVHVDGPCEVLDAVGEDGQPDEAALDAFVDYFRAVAGEHDDWQEYRQAMVAQGKSLLRLTPESWSPVATGGFPPELA